VLSAHIEVVGEKAVDAFYVRCRGSDGKLPEKRRKALRKILLNVLEIKSTDNKLSRKKVA